MQNILIRADSSSKIGLGHIMRDLVLAKQFPKSSITFATQELKGNINNKILEANHKIEILLSNNKKELVKLIKRLKIDLLIIDHYAITQKIEKYIKEKTNTKIFVLDDTYEKHNCDILLNHNIGANKKRYKNLVPKHCELRCGYEYTLIRDEFKNLKEDRIIKKKPETVFISLGGTDNFNLNITILKALKNLKIILVTTHANVNLPILQEYIKKKKNIKLYINTDNIAQLMRRSDFAIITPSVTAHEVIHLKIPFILVNIMPNQSEVYAFLKKDFLHLNKKNVHNIMDKVNIIIKKYDYYINKFNKGKYNAKQ